MGRAKLDKVRFDFFAPSWLRMAVDWAMVFRRAKGGNRAFLNVWLEEACVEKLQREHPGRFDAVVAGTGSIEEALSDKPKRRRGGK